jgi:hypothetical protein
MGFPYIASLSWEATHAEYSSASAFRVGQLGMAEDGSMYRLCKAGAALTNPLAGKINAYTYLEACTGDCAEAATSTAIADGTYTVTVLDTSTIDADYYKDGYAVIPNSGTVDSIRHIKSSTAGAGTSVTITVDAPFTQTYAAGGTMALYPNPFNNIKNAGAYGAGNEHFACEISRPITSGYYFWGKVRGPHWCWFAGIGGNWPGADANDRTLCFHTNGAVDLLDRRVHGGVLSPQIAGYLMYSGNYGDVMVYLQIE